MAYQYQGKAEDWTPPPPPKLVIGDFIGFDAVMNADFFLGGEVTSIWKGVLIYSNF